MAYEQETQPPGVGFCFSHAVTAVASIHSSTSYFLALQRSSLLRWITLQASLVVRESTLTTLPFSFGKTRTASGNDALALYRDDDRD